MKNQSANLNPYMPQPIYFERKDKLHSYFLAMGILGFFSILVYWLI